MRDVAHEPLVNIKNAANPIYMGNISSPSPINNSDVDPQSTKGVKTFANCGIRSQNFA